MQIFGKEIDFSLGGERSHLLICMGVSLFIWTLMKLSDSYPTTRHVHFEYKLPPLMQFSSAPPEKLEATINATGFSIIGGYLRSPHPSITIDLRENAERSIERGELLAAVQDRLKLNVTGIDRNYLSLELDSMLNKKVPVNLVHELKFAPDFFPLDSFQLSVDSIFISGTPDQLAQISEVKTEVVSAPPINQDFFRKVKILAPLEGKIGLGEEETDLLIRVEQFTEKKFTVPVRIPDLPDSIQLIPSEVEVSCVVSLSRYQTFLSSDVKLEADFSEGVELASQNRVPVKIGELPPWVRSIELVPPVVEFFIVQ